MLKQFFYLLLTFLLASGYALAGDFVDDFEDAEMNGWITLDKQTSLPSY